MLSVLAASVCAEPLWRQMPVRSQEEYNLGMIGGENTQHMHGTARSESHPDVIYMAHDCAQTWRSSDAGATWQKSLCRGMNLNAAQSIEVDPLDPDIVFCIVDDSYNYFMPSFQGLYRSTNGGDNWTLVLQKTSQQTRMYQHCVDFDPASKTATRALRWYAAMADDDPNPDTGGYTASPDAAIYRSEDGGDSWQKGASLPHHYPLYAIHCHPTDGQTVYVCADEGLFVSTDRGATLQPLGNLPSGQVSSLAINPQDPDEMWAVVRGTGLYHSTDGGTTFALARSFDAMFIFLNPGHPNVLYLVKQGSPGQSEVSSSGGASWTAVTVTPPPGLGREWKTSMRGAMTGVVPDPRDPNKAVAYFNAEFWKTEDAGRHWTDSSTFFTGYAASWWADGWAFDVADPDRWVMFCCDVSTIKTTTNGDWFSRHRVPYEWYSQRPQLIPGIGCYAGDIQPIAGSPIIVAAAGMYWNNKLIRTADDGTTWSIVCDDIRKYLFVGFHPDEPTLCFSENMRSTDAGLSWQPMTGLTALNASAYVVGLCRAQPDTLYATDPGSGRIYRSDDRGTSWRLYVDASWSFRPFDSKPTIAVHPTDPDVILTLDNYGDLARYNGAYWHSMGVLDAAGGPGPYRNFVRLVAVDPRHPEVIYASMFAPGLPCVFRSTDGGTSWQDITLNLPHAGSGSMYVNPYTGELLHGSAYGTWVYPPPYEGPTPLYDKLIFELKVAGWEVLADHGVAGEMALSVADGDTEPRAGGPARLRATFSTEIDPATLGPAQVSIVGASSGDQSALVQSVTLAPDNRSATIGLSAPLASGDVYTVALADTVTAAGGILSPALTGDRDLVLGVFTGDADGSGAVGGGDILSVRAMAGRPLDATTCRFDVNRSGSVTGDDLLAVRSRLGQQMP